MLTGKHRSSIAITAAVLLTGVGVAVATEVTSPEPAPAATPSAIATATADPRAAELEKSVNSLLAQVGSLEAAVAANEIPVAPPAPVPAARPSASSSSSSVSQT
ncbi:MAG: hypothetical protein H7269_00845, partial [Cellulomonas sp.]|nr:hypothetical protein [Cellulomonas sp.]